MPPSSFTDLEELIKNINVFNKIKLITPIDLHKLNIGNNSNIHLSAIKIIGNMFTGFIALGL